MMKPVEATSLLLAVALVSWEKRLTGTSRQGMAGQAPGQGKVWCGRGSVDVGVGVGDWLTGSGSGCSVEGGGALGLCGQRSERRAVLCWQG